MTGDEFTYWTGCAPQSGIDHYAALNIPPVGEWPDLPEVRGPMLWPANPLLLDRGLWQQLPGTFTAGEAGLRQQPATAYELILRAHAARQAGLWQLPDDPLDPAAWWILTADVRQAMTVHVYRGPTLIEYRRQYADRLVFTTDGRTWQQTVLRMAVEGAVSNYGMSPRRGGRLGVIRGGRQVGWLDQIWRDVAAHADRRRRNRLDPFAWQVAHRLGSLTVTDGESWRADNEVHELLAHNLLDL